jgi:cytochrome P450
VNKSSVKNGPAHDDIDRRKSAELATRETRPDEGAYWVRSANLARRILRSKESRQAGASADFVKYENPEHAPVFFLDGDDHLRKRRKTKDFLSPKTVSDQHVAMMRRITDEIMAEFKQKGEAKLEDLGFRLAIEVVGEILGLTNSDETGRARRVQNVLKASIANAGSSAISRLLLNLARAYHVGIFFIADVRPAIKARKASPRNDAISFFLSDGYSSKAIVIECLTYGTAGMLTTREFITMAAWYLFEDKALCDRFLHEDAKGQLAILMEILRLEPVAAMVHRRVDEEVNGIGNEPIPPGEKFGIDIRAANVDKELVGECPFAVDPDRAKRQKDTGRYLSFGDGPHTCPGWQVALHETRIFLEQLFQIPGITLKREPDIHWNAQLKSYELRNANIQCQRNAC